MATNLLETQTLFEGKLKIGILNQPDNFNPLSRQMIGELIAFFKSTAEDEKVRCVALTGEGAAFCSGQNLKEVLSLGKIEDKIAQQMVEDYYNPLVKAVVQHPKPVVALVNGPAVGAGAMLALICDFTLMKKSAYFSLAFSKIGLIPDTGGTYFLTKLLGRQLASYLTFTGKKVGAEEALQRGLAAEVFDDAAFEEASLKVLAKISEMPTVALSLTKKAMNDSYHLDFEKQLEREGVYQQQAAETEDFKEGVTAFLEKRKPVFKGK